MTKRILKPRDPYWRVRRALGHKIVADKRKAESKRVCRKDVNIWGK